MKITIRESMTRGETLTERLAWLEAMDIDGVELHAGSMSLPDDAIRAAFAASSRGVSAIDGIPRLLDADAAVRSAARTEVRRRIALARDLDAVGVLIVPQFGGRAALPDLTPLASGADLERDLLLAQLRDLAPAAVEAGVVLFLEPLNRYEAYLVNRVEQGAELAALAGAGVATMGDFFHMGIEEVDIAAAFADNIDKVAYVHIADSNRAQPGAGHMDFAPGFRALKAGGYDGWIGLEWSRTAGDYETAIRDAVRLVREQWAAA